jgi:hypothetical protein
MPASEMSATLRLTGIIIERHLAAAFGELDSATGSVETRKRLHAAFVQQAILTASKRFPGNNALLEAIDSVMVVLREPDDVVAVGGCHCKTIIKIP